MPAESDSRGRLAERIAAWLLRLAGYRVLVHRYRTPVGEIAKVRIEGVTVHSGRVGHASELIAYGASTTEVILSGGWKTAHMVVHYAAGDGRTRRGGEIFLGACQFPHLTGQHGRLAGYQTRHRVLLHFAKIRCKLNA